MARSEHVVSLSTPTALSVGSGPLELPVRRGGRRYGVLTVSARGVQWKPSTSRPPVEVSWEDLPGALASAASPADAGSDGRRGPGPRGAAGTGRARPSVGGTTRRRGTGAPSGPQPRTVAAQPDGAAAEGPANPADPADPANTVEPTAAAPADEAATANSAVDQAPPEQGAAPDPQDQRRAPGPVVGDGSGVAPGAETATPARAPVVDLASSTAPVRSAGRRAATRRSAKKAAPRRAGEPEAKEVTSAPARAAGGSAAPGPDARAVRQWAAANGIAVPPRGPLSTRVREQYLAAH